MKNRNVIRDAWQRRSRRRQRRRWRNLKAYGPLLELLEARELLTLAAAPVYPIATGGQPLEVQIGVIDAGRAEDLVTLNANGSIDVALNGDDNHWASRQSIDLGLGPLNGLRLVAWGPDPYSDLVVQGPDAISYFKGNGQGGFVWENSVAPTASGRLAPAIGGRVALDAGYLNSDGAPDLVTVVPGTNEVLVFLGTGVDQLPLPTAYASGGTEPLVARVGQVVGDLLPDIVVGHADGTVTWLEGTGDGRFVLRSDLTISGLDPVFDLQIADLDGDSDNDVVASGGSQVTVLSSRRDPLVNTPVSNGSFAGALTGWETEIIGHQPGKTPGRVNAMGGFAELHENDSFLVSLRQTLVVPPSPQTIEFDLQSLGLEEPLGGVPDAFEVSLLDEWGVSLVPSHRPQATSFLNANPGADIALAPGVSFDGRHVTLDISALAPGTRATLFFDLLGNPAGDSSVVSLDNVSITPNAVFDDSVSPVAVGDSFLDASGLVVADVDGDANLDLVVADAGANALVVLTGNGVGGFVREDLDMSFAGMDPRALAAGRLTTDAIVDVALALQAANVVLTPLMADQEGPTAEVIDPDISQPVRDPFATVTVAFSEPMRDGGAAAANSVTNVNGYRLVNIDQGLVIPLASASYDPISHTVVVAMESTALPLPDGHYRFTLSGSGQETALQDLSGNALGMGVDQQFVLTVNRLGPDLAMLSPASLTEGSALTLEASFADPGGAGPYDALVDWGDGTLTALTANSVNGQGTVAAQHWYADDGEFVATISLLDDRQRGSYSSAPVIVGNVPPEIAAVPDQQLLEGQLWAMPTITFSDPGFTAAGTGQDETFSATVDWGDGSPVAAASVAVVNGAPGAHTTGKVDAAHLYAAAGDYLVTVTVRDDDQGIGQTVFTATVTATNAPPILAPIDPVRADEGATVTWRAIFVDPADLGTHTATIDWGDGSESPGAILFAADHGTISGQHVYANEGTYVVQVTVTDASNLSDTAAGEVVIGNLAPTLSPAPDQTVLLGDTLSLTLATFTDPAFGGVETFQAEVAWGDGTGESIEVQLLSDGEPGVPTSGWLSGSHLYQSAGSYTVTVTLSDGTDVANCSFQVSARAVNSPPVILGGLVPSGNLLVNGGFEDGLLLDGIHFYGDSFVPGWHLPTSQPFADSVTFGGHFYRLLPPGLTWTEAEAAAQLQGGHLVTIGSQAEQDFLVSTFGSQIGQMWIGFTDHSDEGHFSWISGQPVTYVNWKSGEPNDYHGEDYTAINLPWAGGQWNDLSDAGSGDVNDIRGIVEIDPRVIYFDGHYYLLGTAGLNWLEAQAEAAALGGNLVAIGSEREQQFLVAAYGHDHQRLWIGLSDATSEGTFAWVNGEATDYTAWQAGEPNDYGAGEDYAELNVVWFGGSWNDVPNSLGDDWSPRGIIEIDPQAAGISASGDHAFIFNTADKNFPVFELWRNTSASAASGATFLELDSSATHRDTFWQDLETTPGASYDLSFDVRRRDFGSATAASNELQVWWDGQLVGTFAPTDPQAWQTVELTVTATGNLSRIEFREAVEGIDGGGDSYGPFIDNVQVTTPVLSSELLFAVGENAAVGSLITTLSARDPDGTPLAYSILAGNEQGHFAIDVDSGVITLAGSLDYESTASYLLEVQVSDGELADRALVTIQVANENEPPLILDRRIHTGNYTDTAAGFHVTARTIFQGQLSSPSIGWVTVSADGLGVSGATGGPDEQLGNAADVELSEQIVVDFEAPVVAARVDVARLFRDEGDGGEQGRWQVFRQGDRVGEGLFQAPPGDHQVAVSIFAEQAFDELVLSATSYAGGQSTTGDSSDYLVRAIDFAFASTTPSQHIEVTQSDPPGTIVAQVTALDPNGDRVTFAITQGNVGNAFAIDSATGSISLANELDASAISSYDLTVVASDGWSQTSSVVHVAVNEPPPTKFYVVDADDYAYRYASSGASTGQMAMPSAIAARGAATTAAGDRIWILSDEGSEERVYLFGTASQTLLGSWEAEDLVAPQGIATNGTDIWIVDDFNNRVQRYANAASRLGGEQRKAGYFYLAAGNTQPTGITTDGSTLWVVDDRANKVFVYRLGGGYLGAWALDPANSNPSGITVDPSGGDKLWVVDDEDNSIYFYAAGATWRSGSRAATGTTALAGGNRSPQGIADPPGPIDFGTTYADALAVSGEVDEWTFVGTAGQTIYVDFTNLTNGPLTSELIAPDSSVLDTKSGFSRSNLDSGPWLLTQTGEYTLRLSGSGNYSFIVHDVPAANVMAYELDTVATGSIATLTAEDHFTFAGSPGDQVYLKWLSLNNGATVQLRDPNGVVLQSKTGITVANLNMGLVELPLSGTYTIVVRNDASSTLNYSFTVAQVAPTRLFPLQLDEPVSRTLETMGSADHYLLRADAGEQFFFDMGQLDGWARARLLAPSGAIVSNRYDFVSSNHDYGPVVFPETGTYRLEISSDRGDIAEYEFRFFPVPTADSYPLRLGQIHVGSIETPGRSDLFTFDGTAGQVVYFDMQQIRSAISSTSSLKSELLSPTGSVLFTHTNFLTSSHDHGPLVLPADGTYTLRISGSGDNVANYQFGLAEVTPAAPQPIATEEVVTGAIDVAGREWHYQLDVVAGESLTLDVIVDREQLISSVKPAAFRLLSPTGSVVLNNVTSDTSFTAAESGTYLLIASGTSDRLGRYTFRVTADAASALPDPAELLVSNVTATRGEAENPAQITVSWTVTNVGTGAASGWFDAILLSAEEAPGGLTVREAARTANPSPLGPGESYRQTTTWTLPDNFDGEFWVYVDADFLHDVFEGQNEFNNLTRAAEPTYVRAAARPLSGGPGLSVSPPDQSHFLAGTSLALTGTANAAQQAINAIFVLDISTSTLSPSGLDANFDGRFDQRDDLNNFPNLGDVLDAEIGATLRLIEQLSTLTDDLQVATILFAEGSEPLDAGPEEFNQVLVDPQSASYEGDRNELPNFEFAMRSLWNRESPFLSEQGAFYFRDFTVTPGTVFQPALRDVARLVQGAAAQETSAADRTLIYFLTDGVAFDAAPLDVSGVADQGVELYAFQIGGATVTPQLEALANAVDADPRSTGIALAVNDPQDLAAQLLSTLEVVRVTVNGDQVVALDPAGNFFTPVTILPGANSFAVTATSLSGRETTSVVTLYGDEPGERVDLSRQIPAPAGLEAHYSRTTFNRRHNQVHFDLSLVNHAGETITGPVTAIFDSFSAPLVVAANAEVVTADGRAVYTWNAELPAGGLAVDSTSEAIQVVVDNPARDRFQPQVQFQMPPATSPLFASIPPLVAVPDQAYRYQTTVLDPDGDPLTFHLAEAPAGMAIEAAAGEVTWNPTGGDVGHHSVLISVDDGRGGMAEQRFTLLVPSPLPNNPPLILSRPGESFVTVNESFSYTVVALDPDQQPTTLTLGPAAPAGSQLIGRTLRWTPAAADIGTTTFTVLATDPEGAVGSQTFELRVLGANTAPEFVSVPVVAVTAGTVYHYGARAIDTDDVVTYELVAAPAGMTISSRSGSVRWEPSPGDVGRTVPVTVRAIDARGLSADQSFALEVSADRQAPLVAVYLSTNLAHLGDTVAVQVRARDNVALASLSLSVDGTPLTLDSNHSASFIALEPGLPEILATAVDGSGNVGLGRPQPTLRVFDPSDTEPPVVEIVAPLPGATVTYLTEILGSVSDTAGNLEYYELQYAAAGTNQFVTVSHVDCRGASGSCPSIAGSLLGQWDPTLLPNDLYDVRLVAQDTNGQQTVEQFEVEVQGQAKLGNFRLEFTDLVIPLAGIPIQINRTYDTLEADISSDFGFGWSLGLYAPRVRESVRVTQAEQAGAGMFGAAPFRQGTRVYLTAPDGRRVGFTFDPVPEPGFLGAVWRPRFVPDPGVYDQLEVADVPLAQHSDGTFQLYLFGFPYNPAQYTLTTKDQRSYRIDQFAGVQEITDRNGVVLSVEQHGIFSSVGPSIAWIRDEQGRITEIIDPAGNSIHYGYNEAGELVAVTDQVLNATTISYLNEPAHYLDEVIDPLDNLVSKTLYDGAGRVAQVVDALGNSVTHAYDLANNRETIADRLGHEFTLVFDERGNIIQELDPLGNATSYLYDANDNAIEITNPRGFTTIYDYDSRGNVTRVTDPLLGEVTTTYNDRNDVLTVTDQLGRVTEDRYDAQGNLVEQVDALGHALLQTFDSNGRVLTRTDRNGNMTTFEYLGSCGCAGSPSRITYPDGAEESFTYNHFGRITSATDELGHTTMFVYDASGRPLSTHSPDGQVTSNSYTGHYLTRQTTKINATQNRVTDIVYDAVGNVRQVTDANGGVTAFTYDAEGNVTSLTDPVNNTTLFEYDSLQRLGLRRDPLGNETRYRYNELGSVIEILDRNGRYRRFDYDALDRPTAELWLAPDATLVRTITSTYDAVGNLVTQSDPDSAYAWTYDALDRVTSEDNLGTPDLPHLILTWEYDGNGNRTAVYDNSGVRVDAVYGSRDELLSQRWSGGGVDEARVDFQYNERGARISVERFDDLAGVNRVGRSTLSYDSSGRTTGMVHFDATDAAIAAYDYAYDFADRLIRETNHGETIDYGYDLLGQLISADRTVFPDEFYEYDANGNRIRSHLHGANYVTGPDNQLLSDGDFYYEYDKEGSLIRKTEIASGNVTEYAYDHRNRRIEAIEEGPTGTVIVQTESEYDSFDRRIKSITNGVAVHFTYDDRNAWAEFDGTLSLTARYLVGNDIDDMIARWEAPNDKSWYLNDQLGSVTIVAGNSGVITETLRYDSFGRSLTQPSDVRFGFTGREFDLALGEYYYRSRFYNPSVGRFMEVDPIGFSAGDTNSYRYVGNSPQNYSDPFGLLAAAENFSESGKKDATVAKGACNTGRATRKVWVDILFGLLNLAAGAEGEIGQPKIPDPDPPAITRSFEPPPSKQPPVTNPGGKRPRGLRRPPGNSSPFGPGC